MVVVRRTGCRRQVSLPKSALVRRVLSLMTYILRLLHSAQACGVVILLAAPAPLDLGLSCGSADAFRGVTPWKVWNMPPCAGTAIVGAIMRKDLRELR